MKTYKHKRLGRIAETKHGKLVIYDKENQVQGQLDTFELIENSDDWIEIEEKDWRQELYYSLDGLYGKQLDEEETYPMFLERLSKFLPKISKLELCDIINNGDEMIDIIDLLRSKGLLLDTKDQ